MTLLILSEGLSSFEMWGNHSEEFMCVHPGWNFHYKKCGVDVSTNPKKSCLDYSNYQILQITFRRNKKPPLISRETPELFFAASKKPPPKKTPRVSRYFASYKKKSVRLPMAVASHGKNWWEREGENPWDGGPRWNNQPHEYTWKSAYLLGPNPLLKGSFGWLLIAKKDRKTSAKLGQIVEEIFSECFCFCFFLKVGFPKYSMRICTQAKSCHDLTGSHRIVGCPGSMVSNWVK